MLASGISSNDFFGQAPDRLQNRIQQFQKEFKQLGQNLQAGNLSAAREDYSAIQLDVQASALAAPHRHHLSGGASRINPIAQEFAELGQALSSGNLTAAQQAYRVLQEYQPTAQSSGAERARVPSSPNSLSLTA